MQCRTKLRVALAALAPFVSGAEIAAERLALGLQQAGHEVLCILGTQGPALDRMQQAGLRCLFLPMYHTDKWHWFRYYKVRKDLQRLLAREQPDIVHSNDLPTHQIMSDAAGRLHLPRICHHRFPFHGAAIDWLNKYGAEHHLFISQALLAEMCANSVRLSASEKSVIYDGLPLPKQPTSADRLQARRQLGLPIQKTLVTFAGQIAEHKGVADLLHAWSLVDSNVRLQAELLIIGEDLQSAGKYREVMQHLANQLHCEARFVGFQQHVGEWLLASDIVVVPSHVEPLGLVILEAMSYVLPVIGCAVGGIPEVIVHAQTGLLIPPHTPTQLAMALTHLLTDTNMRALYGRQGRQRCEQMFGLEINIHKVVQLYTEVINRYQTSSVSSRP